MIYVGDAIQDEFIRGTSYNFADAPHQFWDERPGERRHQGAKEITTPPGQARSGNTGHEALLIHNAQDALTSRRVHIWLLIEHARDCGLGNACQACDIQDRQLLGHNKPSQWAVVEEGQQKYFVTVHDTVLVTGYEQYTR